MHEEQIECLNILEKGASWHLMPLCSALLTTKRCPAVAQINREEIVIFGGCLGARKIQAEDNLFVLHVPSGVLRKVSPPEATTSSLKPSSNPLQVSGPSMPAHLGPDTITIVTGDSTTNQVIEMRIGEPIKPI